ncbi:MAG: RHS repeat domain-containing protein, partial [Bacteroidales bacterium]
MVDDLIAAVVGGVINLATNWKNIDNVWEGLGAFGAGAANGWLTLNLGPAGAAIGGSITGAANNIIAQTGNGVGLNQVNWGQVGMQGLVGGASGIAGYGAGKWATNNLGNTIINGFKISSPVVSEAI